MKKLILFFSLMSFCFALENVVIKIEKMHCPLCTMSVKKAIKSLDGIKKVSVKLNTKLANVYYDESKVSKKEILEAIKTTSYEGKILEKK